MQSTQKAKIVCEFSQGSIWTSIFMSEKSNVSRTSLRQVNTKFTDIADSDLKGLLFSLKKEKKILKLMHSFEHPPKSMKCY